MNDTAQTTVVANAKRRAIWLLGLPQLKLLQENRLMVIPTDVFKKSASIIPAEIFEVSPFNTTSNNMESNG